MRRKIIIMAVSSGIALGAAIGVAQPAMAQGNDWPGTGVTVDSSQGGLGINGAGGNGGNAQGGVGVNGGTGRGGL